jgi:hypothetical protein
MPQGKKISKKVIFAIVLVGIIIVIGSCIGIYVYITGINHQHFPSRGRGNFTFNNETLNQTSDYFNNNSDLQTVQAYCQQNMIYCRYYCDRTDPNNSLCSQLQFPQFSNNKTFQPMINYSGNGGSQ